MKMKHGKVFDLVLTKSGQYWIKLHARLSNCEPTARHISASDARYLLECGNSFDAACVMDFGVGVFQKGQP